MRFLDAEMDPAEMEAFEKELNTTPELRRQLNFEQSLRDSFALQNITSLPGTAPANKVAPAPPGKVTGMRKWLAISAAAVVIITFTLLALLRQKPGSVEVVVNNTEADTTQGKSNQPPVVITEPAKNSSEAIDLPRLFKQYFKKDVLPDHYPLFLAEALTDYEAGNYATLQQLNLNDLPQTRSVDEANNQENILKWGYYYKGLAFLQTGNTKEAATNLNQVLNNERGTALKAKAQWYLALTYLKENNSEKAAELCRNIVRSKENNLLVKNAEKILNALGK